MLKDFFMFVFFQTVHMKHTYINIFSSNGFTNRISRKRKFFVFNILFITYKCIFYGFFFVMHLKYFSLESTTIVLRSFSKLIFLAGPATVIHTRAFLVETVSIYSYTFMFTQWNTHTQYVLVRCFVN